MNIKNDKAALYFARGEVEAYTCFREQLQVLSEPSKKHLETGVWGNMKL